MPALKVRLKNLTFRAGVFIEKYNYDLRKKVIITELYEKLCIFGKYLIIPVTDRNLGGNNRSNRNNMPWFTGLSWTVFRKLQMSIHKKSNTVLIGNHVQNGINTMTCKYNVWHEIGILAGIHGNLVHKGSFFDKAEAFILKLL